MDVAQFTPSCVTPTLYEYKPLLSFYALYGDIDRLVGMFDYIKKDWKEARPPTLAVLAYEAATSRQSEAPLMFEFAEKAGVNLVPFDYYGFTVTDFSTELTRIYEKKKADYIFLRGGPSQTGNIMKDAVRLGLKDKMTWITSYFSMEPEVVGIAGAEACEGLLAESGGVLPIEADVPGVKLSKEINARYHNLRISAAVISGTGTGLLMHEVFKRALEKVGLENLSGSAIADEFWGLKNFDTMGIFPSVTMREGCVSTTPYIRMVRWRADGEIEPLTEFIECPWVVGNPEYYPGYMP